MDVSKNSGTPKSSILIGFSIINHPFWGTPIFGNTHKAQNGSVVAGIWATSWPPGRQKISHHYKGALRQAGEKGFRELKVGELFVFNETKKGIWEYAFPEFWRLNHTFSVFVNQDGNKFSLGNWLSVDRLKSTNLGLVFCRHLLSPRRFKHSRRGVRIAPDLELNQPRNSEPPQRGFSWPKKNSVVKHIGITGLFLFFDFNFVWT